MAQGVALALLVLPFDRDQGSVLDACLGAALARSLERKLAAAGLRVLPSRAGTRACDALGMDAPLDEEEAREVARHSGATHIVQGVFEREQGKLVLMLQVCARGEGETAPEPGRVVVSGDASTFQGVLEQATAQILDRAGAPASAAKARETESFEAFVALARAQTALLEGDVSLAEEEIEKAQKLDPLYVDPYEVAASAAREMGDRERTLESLRAAARLHHDASRSQDEANALLALGHALVDGGRWDDGVRAYDDAAALWEKAGDVRGVVQARSNVANVHFRRGDYKRAVQEYEAGLERLGVSRGTPHVEDAAKLAFNLGTALKAAGDLAAATRRFEEARRLGVEAHDDDLIANAYNALGTVHDEQGDLDKALHFYRQAEEHLEARADPVLLGGVKDNIGIVLKKRADLEGALAYSAQACQLFETHGDPHRLAIAYTNRAGLLLDLDRGDEALPFALSAHRIFVQLGSPQAKTTEALLEDLGVDPEEAHALDLEDSSGVPREPDPPEE
jgi:tetratricopeptide (TPR) repeat protein